MGTNKPEPTNFGYWNAMLADASEAYRDFLEAEKEFVLQRVYGADILDFGCGDGRVLSYLSDYAQRRLYGVDSDPEAVFSAKEKFLHSPNVSILREDARQLPFMNGFFANVLCLNFAVNFGEHREIFYQEMKRVLHPAGDILLSVFNEDAFDERMKLYKFAGAPIHHVEGTTVYFDYKEGLHPSEQFSKSQLEGIFDENGLHPHKINKHGIEYLCDLKKK